MAAYAGALTLVPLWPAVLPLDSFMDPLYAAALLLTYLHAGRASDLGDWWARHAVVRRDRWME